MTRERERDTGTYLPSKKLTQFRVQTEGKMSCFTGFPCTLENLENLENKKINFQTWKNPVKKKIMKMSWKNPGNSFKIHTKLELSTLLEDLYPKSILLPHIIVPENLNFNLEKSWQSP